jgi:hypothetical protein
VREKIVVCETKKLSTFYSYSYSIIIAIILSWIDDIKYEKA